jgi:hypothetical protein
MPAKAGIRKLQRSGHNTKQTHMKQISQSISNSTKSLPGRWTKVTTVGCILALVFLGATSALPKASGTARPFNVTGIFTSVYDEGSSTTGTFLAVGNATHLGKIVFTGPWQIIGGDFQYYTYLVFHVAGTYTAANGDTLNVNIPEWVVDYTATPAVGTGLVNIIGGTGRFADASGSYSAVIVYGDTAILTGEGTISY